MTRFLASIAFVAACFAALSIPSQQPASGQQFVGVPSAETLQLDLSALEGRVESLEGAIDFLSQQPAAIPVPAAPVVRQSLAQSLGVDHPSLASPSWTYPGNIQSHLSSGHDVDASGLSRSEAVALHNRLHNAEERGVPIGAVSYVAEDCPNGMCPTGPFSGVSDSCPTGNCPTSSVGSVGAGASSGPVRGVISRIRERQPIRSFIGRFRCR